MAKLRGLILVGLLGLLVVCAPPAQAVVLRSADVPVSALSVTTAQAFLLAPPPPGPVLDPAQTSKADSEKTRNKVIAGGVAVVLAAIVFFGRRLRSKKRKKTKDQAQGK